MTEREKISARIRALLAKTVDNGCTEDEAVAAAEMAQRLLAKYNLTVDEATLRENPFKRVDVERTGLVTERIWRVCMAIGELTGTRYWLDKPKPFRPTHKHTFFGFDHEVEIAEYLCAICERAMRDGALKVKRDYAPLRESRRRSLLMSYLDGMSVTLAERIRAMIPEQPKGTGLVVVRNILIKQELNRLGIHLEKGNVRKKRIDDTYFRGVEEAKRVALNKGLSGNTEGQRRLQC